MYVFLCTLAAYSHVYILSDLVRHTAEISLCENLSRATRVAAKSKLKTAATTGAEKSPKDWEPKRTQTPVKIDKEKQGAR